MEVIVKSKNGLHARPASLIVEAASKFLGDIHLVKGNEKFSAKSIMGIMRMGLCQGDSIDIIAEGDGSEQIETIIKDIIEGIKE